MTPRLGTLWNGAWTYETTMGVGIRLEGLPTDVDEFILILASHGCHPNASNRILSRITTRGYDELTISASLNFIALAKEMNKLSVLFSIIPPLEGWEEKYQDGEFDPALLEKAKRLHEDRRDRL